MQWLTTNAPFQWRVASAAAAGPVSTKGEWEEALASSNVGLTITTLPCRSIIATISCHCKNMHILAPSTDNLTCLKLGHAFTLISKTSMPLIQ